MAEHSSRSTRGRLSVRGGRRGVTQIQDHGAAEMVLKTNDQGCEGETGVIHSESQESRTEEEVDLYTWCEQCGMNTIGDCFIHGKVITVTDNKLPSRARLSLPSVLTLKNISNEADDGKEGVFAKRLIKPRTQFGPLEAPASQNGAMLPLDIFDVRVLKSGRLEQLDLSKEEACNWMMFVRPAQCSQQCNLAAYQLKEHIYYISTKTIHQMTELRVWYLQSYGQLFGKEPLPATLPLPKVFPSSTDEAVVFDPSESPETNMAVVGTRSTTASLSSSKLVCGLCNIPFRSLSQLVAHNCKVLDETQINDASPRPARRKGRPRKVSGTNKRGRPVTRASNSMATSSLILPSVNTLMKNDMKTEVAVPDSTVSDIQHEQVGKKRGRPKGSKNKTLEENEDSAAKKKVPEMKRKRPRLDCSYCGRSFYSEEQHRVHEAEHTGMKPYICPYDSCGKGFGSKFKFCRHSLIHEQPQNRQCLYCDRTFNRIDHLKNHIATHDSNRQQWTCEKCGKQYLYRSTFVYHMAVHQAQEGGDMICSICHTEFKSRDALLEHVHTHNRYKPDPARSKNHECPKCQKRFTTSKDVRRHMVTHTKDRSFLCEFCPQTFARKDHLRRHYKSNHKKEVLEQAATSCVLSPCLICLKPFNSEKHLQYHMSSAHPDIDDALAAVRTENGAKRNNIMQVLPHNSKMIVMQGAKITIPDADQVQQQVQQQQLSLMPQSTAQAGTIHPVHIQINPQDRGQRQSLLQAGSYITNLPAMGSGGQAEEIVVDGSDQYGTQMLTLKTIPYRFTSEQVLASVQSNQSAPPSIPTASSLRQLLNYSQSPQTNGQQIAQQQLASQVTQPQQIYTQADVQSTQTIVSMLSSRPDGFLDLGGKGQAVFAAGANGQPKSLPTQWVLTGNTMAIPDSSSMQVGSDSDHCYATGVTGATTVAGDIGLKLSSLSSIGGKVINSVTTIPDLDTFRLLQNCQLGGLGVGTAVGGNTQPVFTQATTAGNSASLQASWDTLSDLVTIPLSDIMTPLSGSQASVINLPVTVSVPVTDGSVSVPVSVTLSQPS